MMQKEVDILKTDFAVEFCQESILFFSKEFLKMEKPNILNVCLTQLNHFIMITTLLATMVV